MKETAFETYLRAEDGIGKGATAYFLILYVMYVCARLIGFTIDMESTLIVLTMMGTISAMWITKKIMIFIDENKAD